MLREKSLTQKLKAYDRELLVRRNEKGILCVYRKSNMFDRFDFRGKKLYVSRSFDQYIMALTDNWNTLGTPVDWGIEPLLCRIKAMDLWANPQISAELITSYEKAEETKKRDLGNNVESFLRDFRRQFAKATNDINTSTLNKLDKRRIPNGISK